ncbi:MAG TPA: PASTA domain-containing protein [Gaiellaceae bacterium]|nr:PASTA domain-containing protein [Gaiellaceae bacterium]
MLGRVPALFPRLAAIVLACLLATATMTFAANSGKPAPAPAPAAEPAPAPTELVVPDVRNQAYVFAKGSLEDAGLAWKVVGPVQGYAANVVRSQSPAPGTRLVADGSPTVTLELSRNPAYAQEGEPENASPYPGATPKLADAKTPVHSKAAPAPAKPALAKPAPAKPAPAAKAAPTKPAPAQSAPAAKPAPAKPAEPSKASAKPAADPAAKPAETTEKPAADPAAKPVAKPDAGPRKPAFVVPGAPPEPQDEISLVQRAEELERWLAVSPKPSDANVRHWLYQHEWIVAGARFGWYGGAEALAKLIEIDRRVEATWGIGTKSRLIAERALAEVRERSR